MDFGNKRYSLIFAGILITFIASIIIVIALGMGDFDMHSSQEFKSYNDRLPVDMSKNLTPTIINYEDCFIKHRIVLGAEIAFDLCHDVEAGWMEVTYDIPYEFPISITEEYVDQNFDITVRSYGGYHPDDFGGSFMTIYQPKTNMGGILEITWDDGMADTPLSTMKYTASFDIVGGGPIILESNHLPDISTIGAEYSFILEAEPTPDLGKWVHVGVYSSWEGCHDANQKFKLILAHKNCVLRIPNSQT